MSSSSPCHPFQKSIKPHSLIQQKVQWYPDHPNSIIIVNSASSLVLDASEPEVKLREFTGSPLQQWEFECPSQASFFLKNVGTGRYLHAQGAQNEFHLVTEAKSGAPSQLWQYNSEEQTVRNPGSNKVLDVQGRFFVPGGQIKVHDHHGGNNQKFVLYYNNL
ncbi:hypothetical protein Zmor_018885 [Zophobas morio]|uniref:Ricin B lectin domain-containing protein n=1 Tax=Zophobas morio TaxID=2755281 RepID=A0AA38I896_9CUCU|nr:hypothetical protein Zmor_018885 [Zophobas morio]